MNNKSKKEVEAHPFFIQTDEENTFSSANIAVGEKCPLCQEGVLDYDGMLNLVCPTCGFTAGGCFT